MNEYSSENRLAYSRGLARLYLKMHRSGVSAKAAADLELFVRELRDLYRSPQQTCRKIA